MILDVEVDTEDGPDFFVAVLNGVKSQAELDSALDIPPDEYLHFHHVHRPKGGNERGMRLCADVRVDRGQVRSIRNH